MDRAARVLLFALLLVVPLPFGSVQPAAVFAVTAASAVLALLALTRRTFVEGPLASPPWLVLLGLFFVVGLVQLAPLSASVLRSVSPAAAALRDSIPGAVSTPAAASIHPGATGEYLARLAAFAAIFAVSATLASRGGYRSILAAIYASGLFQAAYGSIEYLSGHQHIFGYVKRFYTDAATGTYINQNHFAGALEMSLLVGLGFLLSRLRRSGTGRRPEGWRARIVDLFDGEQARTLALATTLAVVALGLVLSYSRSGLAFGAMAALAVTGIDLRVHWDRRRALPLFLLSGAVLILVSLVGWDRVSSDLGKQMGGIGFESGRVRVWRDSLSIIADYPLLGTGWGTFRDVYPLYKHESIRLIYDHAHNDYLQAVVEGGVLGAGALLLILALFSWRIATGLARYRGAGFSLLLGAAGGAASLLLHEITDFNLQIPANAVLFSALAGAVLGGLHPASGLGARGVVPFTAGPARRRSVA